MKKKSSGTKALLIVYWVLALFPLVIMCVAFPHLQDSVAVHFGSGGEPDRWGEKWEAMLIPLFIVVFAAIMLVVTRSSAEYSNQPAKNRTISLIMLFGALVIFNLLTVWVIVFNIPQLSDWLTGIDLSKLLFICVGVLMIFLGILTTRLSKNPLSGARVPWDLTEEDWSRLQYFSRYLLIGGGVILILGCGFFFRGSSAMVFVLVLCALICLSVLLYGWYLKKQEA